MSTYYFPNENITITPDYIVKNGMAGGHFVNDISQGSFAIDIMLTQESGSSSPDMKFGFNLHSPDTMPVDFSVEEIDIWIAAELVQYEV